MQSPFRTPRSSQLYVRGRRGPSSRSSRVGASITSLPRELLEVIFEFGARLPPSYATNDQFPYVPLFSKLPFHPPFAVAVCQVSRRWRDIAMQMHILWASLYISCSPRVHRRIMAEGPRWFSWLPAYLSRSRNFLLDVTIDCTRIPIEEVMRIISPSSIRWQKLTILVSHVGHLPQVLRNFETLDVPQLHTLTIAADIYREGILSTSPIPAFFKRGAPRLRNLNLNRVYTSWNAPPIAWLTTLELHFTTWWPIFPQLKAMFASSPNLSRLVIRDDLAALLRSVDAPHGRNAPIPLPALRDLEIQVHHPRQPPQGDIVDVSEFVRLFSMPSLESLTLCHLHTSEWRLVAGYFWRHTSEFPALRKLALADMHATVGGLTSSASPPIEFDARICAAFPLLTHLSLVRMEASPFLKLLMIQPNRGGRGGAGGGGGGAQWHLGSWPEMRQLSVRGDDKCSGALIGDVVRFREALGRPLGRLYLDSQYVDDQRLISWLRQRVQVFGF